MIKLKYGRKCDNKRKYKIHVRSPDMKGLEINGRKLRLTACELRACGKVANDLELGGGFR